MSAVCNETYSAVGEMVAKEVTKQDDPENEMQPLTAEEWKDKFKAVLDSIESSGSFCVGKEMNMPTLHPKIRIDGIMNGERLAFPLT